jgi:beta-glucanase (GH16 family)
MALDLNGFNLTFNDDFNSFSSTPQGNGGWQSTIYGARTLPNNHEQQFYSDSTVGIDPFSTHDGTLTITASPGSNPDGLWYNSGAISTLGDFSQEYGYFEIRAQLPEGKGMWPGFWLLPTHHAWPPEIDILEAFGATNSRGEGGANQAHINAISSDDGQSHGQWVTVPGSIYSDYHTYGVDWEPDNITYYIDGQQVGQVKTPDDMHTPMYMIANLAVGGDWVESPGGETGHMNIDYIRAYSSDPSHPAVAHTDSSPAVADATASGPDATHDATASAMDPALAAGPNAIGSSMADSTAMPDNHDMAAPVANGAPMDTPPTADASGMATPPAATAGTPVGSGAPAADATSAATGLTLHVSGDSWNGDPQFLVYVDGKQVGDAHTATASHAAGQSQDIAIAAPDDGAAHTVSVKFVNDAFGGAGADRNLYVQSLDMNGHTLAGNEAMNNAAQGHQADDPSAAVMMVDGAVEFHVPQGTATADLWHV